jgi:tight adherence protein C
MFSNPTGPTLMGVDVFFVATILAAIACTMVVLAVYAAVTVRDPMAKRVKALSDRREQLKAGITASTAKKRTKLVRKTETTDKMRSFLSSLKVLQDDQIQVAVQKLAQAGIRKKEFAVAVIFSRLVIPVLLGGAVGVWLYAMGGLPEC